MIEFGQVMPLRVVSTTGIGAFVDGGRDKDILLPFAEQTKEVQKGEEVLVALYRDKSDRPCLTMNVYGYLSCNSPYNKDDRVEGRVYEISKRFGAFVAVDDTYSALIPAKEVTPAVHIGQKVSARVTEVREDGKLTLSLREKSYIQMDADAEFILKALSDNNGVLPYSDSTPSDVIKKELDMSKNAFKRAIGRLYKMRRIVIEENCIRRVENE